MTIVTPEQDEGSGKTATRDWVEVREKRRQDGELEGGKVAKDEQARQLL